MQIETLIFIIRITAVSCNYFVSSLRSSANFVVSSRLRFARHFIFIKKKPLISRKSAYWLNVKYFLDDKYGQY
jgi:hypothetical protein